MLRQAFDDRVAAGEVGFLLNSTGDEWRPLVGYGVGVLTCRDVDTAIASLRDGQGVGYWVDGRGVGHIDVVEVYEGLATALVAAHTNDQGSIYDFSTSTTIEVGVL